jgi:phytoene dehydrogenase-like protein
MRFGLPGHPSFALDASSTQSWIDSLAEAFPSDAKMLSREFPKLARLAKRLHEALDGIVHLPLQGPHDLLSNLRALPGLLPELPTLLSPRSFGEQLQAWNTSDDLRAWIDMNLLITLQAPASEVRPAWAALALFFYPLGTGALQGGMRGLFAPWLKAVQEHPHARVYTRTAVLSAELENHQWILRTPDQSFGPFDLLVSAVPRWNTEALLGPSGAALMHPRLPWSEVADRMWGALVAHVVVRDHASLPSGPFNFHSKLRSEATSSGEAYLSFSARGDLERIAEGYRAVTMSTHVRLPEWQQLPYAGRGFRKRLPPGAAIPDTEYIAERDAAAPALLEHLKQHFSDCEIIFSELGTPRTFERYTGRFQGSVGGVPLSRRFTLFGSLPHRTKSPQLWQVGDTSFPGQSVYACVLGACAAFEELTESSLPTI